MALPSWLKRSTWARQWLTRSSYSLENATLTDWKHEETLERTLEEELQNRLNTDAKAALEKGIDISNSYKKLGNSYRKGYVYYEERREEYEKNLQIKVETEVSVVNLK